MTQIVMPYMTEGIAKHVPEYEAWRWAYFLPGCLFILICFLILVLGQVSLIMALRLKSAYSKLCKKGLCDG